MTLPIQQINECISALDYGNFFHENQKQEVLIFQDGNFISHTNVKNSGYCISSFVDNNHIIYANSDIKSIERNLENILTKNNTKLNKSATLTSVNIEYKYYDNKYENVSIEDKQMMLKHIYDMLHNHINIKSITVRLIIKHQEVTIINNESNFLYDIRPSNNIAVSITTKNDKYFYRSCGGRISFLELLFEVNNIIENIKITATSFMQEKALIPSGKMTVILGSGDPGTLLHEAVGHGLEADFFYQKSSVYSSNLNQKIFNDKITVIDDGTIENKHGTLHFDDEGTPTQKTTLIENGYIKTFMSDRRYGDKCNLKRSGNGRRQGYTHYIFPRMTNTYLKPNSNITLDDMISSVDRGIYATNLGTGQVDIISGQFSFCGEGVYLIEKGKITGVIASCNLSGTGKEVLNNIQAVGNDLAFGNGSCGKNGQYVPVTVGQPSTLISEIQVAF